MIKINPKYNYATLSRSNEDGQRKYLTPDGARLPSVTTILGKTKDQTHLDQWRARVGHAKAAEITTEAAGVGTRMHKYIEDYVGSGSWPEAGSNPYAQQANKMAQRIRDEAMVDIQEVWGSEISLYMPGLYAGTTDLAGVYQEHDAILDFKQTNKPKKEEWVEDYYLQLVAYALAHNEVYGTDIKHGHIFMCSRDLVYQQFDLTPATFNKWSDKWWSRCEEYYLKFGN